jgi:predicted metalloprotease with PDZ domain
MGAPIHKYWGYRLLRRDEVVTLEEYVRRLGERSIWVTLRRVYDEVSSGKIRLEDPKPPKTLADCS